MRYRRALLLAEPGADARPALVALRRLAPELEHLVVVDRPPARTLIGWRIEEGLREALATAGFRSELQFAPALDAEALAALVDAADIELLVDGARTLSSVTLLAETRRRRPTAILWPQEGDIEASGPLRDIGCVALSVREQAPIGAFLRDRVDPSVRVTALLPTPMVPAQVDSFREVSGIRATLVVPPSRPGAMRAWLADWVPEARFDLLVFARLPTAVLLARRWPAPVLLLPPVAPARPPTLRPIDVPDVVDDGGPLHLRVDHALAVGDLPPVPDQEIAFVCGGRVVARLETHAGEVTLPAGLEARSLGVFRTGGIPPADPLAAIEQQVAVIHPGNHPLILFDAEVDNSVLTALAALSGPPVPELLAVRLRPTQSCRSIRERLLVAGLPPHVIDARAALDEGEALDVSEMNDPVRLARVGARLHAAGFPVTAVLHRGPASPEVRGFAAMSAPYLLGEGRSDEALAPFVPAEVVPGNRIELELDNATGRSWLLEAIRRSRREVHFQVYMVSDDVVGQQVEAALAEAAARGVTVRVLVDSLYGLHGSFGIQNPLLERLGAYPGVSLRAMRPVNELPTLKDLKQRDHRKLVVVDGRVALVGGRNLSREYYLGFDEVQLTTETLWRDVPWLDASARLEGPSVAAVAQSFLHAWTEAGGEPFPVVTPPPCGTAGVRVVVHRGLRDARTLEAHRALIDSAQSHIDVVNGFPLVLELQHALLRALQRGVRVRTLIGHVTPIHAKGPFKGFGSAARSAATSLVHSRFDPLIAEGGECYLFAVHERPGWAPELGTVLTHVHAKVMSVDGRRCAVGSANLDITSAYWESE
ncbi:MAG: phosphatidylserine/phosphatidylglycerophosphate/cardiolipin synthase family protein, partial [Myxococcaceae bacterium]